MHPRPLAASPVVSSLQRQPGLLACVRPGSRDVSNNHSRPGQMAARNVAELSLELVESAFSVFSGGQVQHVGMPGATASEGRGGQVKPH